MKSPLEQKLIGEFCDLFSQNLTQDQALKNTEIKIIIIKTKEKARKAYNYRPRNIPENIRKKAKAMIEGMLAQSTFVPKKDADSLRLVIDYTGLNSQVLRPVHAFPSTDMVRNAIKKDTRVMAVLDFLQGYHQLSLHEDSQAYTTFINIFSRFLFCRAPMGLSSSGDVFCDATDKFFAGLGEFMIKQVDDVLMIVTS